MAVSLPVGAYTDSDCLFVCLFWQVYLVSAIKLLNEVCLKTNHVLSDEKKEKKNKKQNNCYIQSIVFVFGGGGGTKEMLTLDSV